MKIVLIAGKHLNSWRKTLEFCRQEASYRSDESVFKLASASFNKLICRRRGVLFSAIAMGIAQT
jgi:hypothetical protein